MEETSSAPGGIDNKTVLAMEQALARLANLSSQGSLSSLISQTVVPSPSIGAKLAEFPLPVTTNAVSSLSSLPSGTPAQTLAVPAPSQPISATNPTDTAPETAIPPSEMVSFPIQPTSTTTPVAMPLTATQTTPTPAPTLTATSASTAASVPPSIPSGHSTAISPTPTISSAPSQSIDPKLPESTLLVRPPVSESESTARSIKPDDNNCIPPHIMAQLAVALQDDAIVAIVRSLEKLQQLWQSSILRAREDISTLHRDRIENLKQQQSLRLASVHPTEQAAVIAHNTQELQEYEKKWQDDVYNFDMSALKEMDNKVKEQQGLLQQAGIPGFAVSDRDEDLLMQRAILNLILAIPSADAGSSLQDRLQMQISLQEQQLQHQLHMFGNRSVLPGTNNP